MSEPVRFLTEEDFERPHPVHAVWEITLACDLKCNHCGSRALKPRPDELSTEEARDIVAQLAGLGCREVTIIGGEAYLRKDWTDIIEAIADHGMRPTMQTGARNLTEKRVAAAAQAGLTQMGISIDGLGAMHDALRGVPGSYDKCIEAIERCTRHGIAVSVNTQVGRNTMSDLRPLMNELIEAGVTTWRVQLTVPMGRAADNDELVLQPYQILELMPLLWDLYQEGKERGLNLQLGNNVGYFGPYESRWRSGETGVTHWFGCNAGSNTLGIEADGTIKGCPSLPTTPYGGGNIRDLSLEKIWNEAPELSVIRERTVEDLWGFCRTCYYNDVCMAGCTWTSHTLFGKPGNNPYCHYRALELAKKGVRERITKVSEASGLPFDHGTFELIEEPLDSQEKAPAPRPKIGHNRLQVIA